MFFVIQRGALENTKMEYSYGRRAQSTIHSIRWRDIGIIQSESAEQAINLAENFIKENGWSSRDGGIWRLEGRGKVIGQVIELSPFGEAASNV